MPSREKGGEEASCGGVEYSAGQKPAGKERRTCDEKAIGVRACTSFTSWLNVAGSWPAFAISDPNVTVTSVHLMYCTEHEYTKCRAPQRQ